MEPKSSKLMSDVSNKENMLLNSIVAEQSEKLQKLVKENYDLKEKVTHLESMLLNNSALLIPGADLMPHEQLICIQQIGLLNMMSSSGKTLTYEEAKKLEIYTKLLNAFKDKNKTDSEKEAVSKQSTDELIKQLRLVDNGKV